MKPSLDLLSGQRAIAENLSLEPLRPVTGDEAPTIDIATVAGVRVPEIDWSAYLSPDTVVPLDPLAALVPHDALAVYLQGPAALVRLLDEAEHLGSPLATLIDARVQVPEIRRRVEAQLGVSARALLDVAAHIESLALCSSDHRFASGTDVTLLIRCRSRAAVGPVAALATDAPAAESLGEVVMLSTSMPALVRVLDAARGATPAMSTLDELRYFRQRYPLSRDRARADSAALVVLTDAAIRKWCGPAWRIAAARRDRRGDGRRTPLADELPRTISRAEEQAYVAFRDGVERRYRGKFDPIAVHLDVDDDAVDLDSTIVPLVGASEYRRVTQWLGGAGLDDAVPARPTAVVHARVHLRPIAELLPRLPGVGFPGLPSPFGWIGRTVELFVEDDECWRHVPPARALRAWASQRIDSLPLGVRIDVAKPLELAAFLVAARALALQALPGVLRWEVVEHGDTSYAQLSLVDTRHAGPVPAELGAARLFYAVHRGTLLITFSEALLRRELAAPTADGPGPQRASQGRHLDLQLSAAALAAVTQASAPSLDEHLARGAPSVATSLARLIEGITALQAGLTFEDDGLRARLRLQRRRGLSAARARPVER